MTSWMIETLAATSLLMMLVLVIRNPVARKFGAKSAYALWLLPALRMILPPLPTTWLAGPKLAMTQVIALSPSDHIAAAQPLISWPFAILGLWSAGALAFFSWHMQRYWSFVDAAGRDADWLREEDRIEIANSPAIVSPVAFGLISRIVMLPNDFTSRYDPTEQRLALSHELAHHRRRDIWANHAALVMLAFHWFNPIAHLAYRAFRTDQEAACDADIIAGATMEERHAYGVALLKSATGGAPLAACSVGVASTIKSRLERLSKAGDPASKWRFLLWPVAVGGLALTASFAGTPQTVRGMVAGPLPQSTLASFAMPVDSIREGRNLLIAKKTGSQQDLALPAIERAAREASELAEIAAVKAEGSASEAQQAQVIAEKAGLEAEMAHKDAEAAARQSENQSAQFQAKCLSANTRQVFVQRDGDRQTLIVTCDDMISLKTGRRTREALTLARADVEHMDMLTPEQRTAVLDGVDKALARLEATEQSRGTEQPRGDV